MVLVTAVVVLVVVPVPVSVSVCEDISRNMLRTEKKHGAD